MTQSGEGPYHVPLHIDVGAFQIGEFVVMDRYHAFVREFDTIDEAEAFVASANGIAPSVLREQTEERVRMLAAYHKNLQSASKGAVARAKPEGAQ